MTKSECPPNDQSHPAAAVPTSQQSPLITPGSALLFASLPLGLGAYIGYRRALHESLSSSVASNGGIVNVHSIQGKSIFGQLMQPEPPTTTISSTENVYQSGSSSSIRQRLPPSPIITTTTTPPPILAARALAIGSLLSLSGSGLLISGIFYASGCKSIDELMATFRYWAPKKLHNFEDALENYLGISVGGKERRNAKLEYERDVKGMTEEEELEYVRKKYGGEMNWDDEEK